MGRSPCCSKEGVNRGAWTAVEDKILTEYIKLNGEGKWRNLPKKAGLRRCGKSCRLRWLNYLRPDIKRGNITDDEEDLIIRLHKLLGNRWSLIAARLPGRTDNEIKNYWNTNIGKKLMKTQNLKDKPSRTEQNPSQNLDQPHVIRTKASRCTKVFITNPPQIPKKHDDDQVVHTSDHLAIGPTSIVSPADYEAVGPEKSLDPFDSSTDFPLDFEMDEFLLSETFGSDFSKLFDFDSNELNGDSNIISTISSLEGFDSAINGAHHVDI